VYIHWGNFSRGWFHDFFPRETFIKLYGTNDCLHSNPTNKLKTLSDGEQEIVIVDRKKKLI
jgi:hypothetical protein